MFNRLKQLLIDWAINAKDVTIAEIYEASAPYATEIDGPDGHLKFTGVGDSSTVLVKTPSGYSPVKRALRTVPYQVFDVQIGDKNLRCADEHILITANGDEVYARDLAIGDLIQTINGPLPVKHVIATNKYEAMYDLELDDDDHVYYTNGILSHNTATAAMFLLWKAMFVKDQTILIASKNQSHAMEIAARVRFAYEELPNWIKCGVKYYNRHRIEFDNGSRIICEATTEKTGRGLSVSCVTGDSRVEIKDTVTGITKFVTMEELEKLLNAN